jgi:hypothetical protein
MVQWERNPLYRARSGSPPRPLLVAWVLVMVGFTAYLAATGHYLIGGIYAVVSLIAGIYAIRRGWNAR